MRFVAGRYAIPIGMALSWAPAADLVRGPADIEVDNVEVITTQYVSVEPTSTQTSHKVTLHLKNGEERTDGVLLTSLHADMWEKLTEPCRARKLPMQATYLRSLFIPIRVQCKAAEPDATDEVSPFAPSEDDDRPAR